MDNIVEHKNVDRDSAVCLLKYFKRRETCIPLILLFPFYCLLMLLGWFIVAEPLILGPPQKLVKWSLTSSTLSSSDTKLEINYTIESNRLCKLTLDRWLENSIIHIFPLISGVIQETGTINKTSIVNLPKLHPGQYKLFTRVRYSCNPFYTYEEIRGPLEFIILE